MAETTLNMQLLLRRDSTFNPSYKLAEGEPGFEVSTNTLKIGDGVKTWAELPIANKAQIDALIKVTDDKVVALTEAVGKLDDTYATDAEVEEVRSALDTAKLDKSVYEAYIATHAMTDTEITTAIGNIDAKFASYRTSADQDAIDETFATKEALKVVTDELAGYGDIVTRNAAEFATAAQGAKADAAAVKTEVDAALLLKADKSVVDAMYTNAQIDELVQGAKDYADTNDANTEYHVEYDSTSKKIKLVAGADASKMEIDATDFIKDGMIDTVTIGDDNDLVITFNTAAGKENIVLPLDQLVDIYTGKSGDRVTVTVASDKSISAEIVAGSISKNYLDSNVQASLGLADTALQAADLTDYAKTADVVTNDEFTQFETTNTAAIKAVADDLAEYVEAHSQDYDNTAIDIMVEDIYKGIDDAVQIKLDANGWTTDEDGLLSNETGSINIGSIGNKLTQIDKDQIWLEANGSMDYAKVSHDGIEITYQSDNYTKYAHRAIKVGNTEEEGEELTINIPYKAGTLALTSDIEAAVNAIDTGVTKIVAGTDVVVTPEAGTGEVTVSHKTYQTGTIKAGEGTEEPNFLTSVTINNGHVESATVQTLRSALESMTFIFDGGSSTTSIN